MSFSASVYEIFLAAPDDTADEQQCFREAVAEWNSLHAIREKCILLPRHWTTDLARNFVDTAQQQIDKHLLSPADIVVGIFRSKLGQGTQHEIETHADANKPTLVYFYTGPVPQNQASTVADVLAFKEQCRNRNFYGEYCDVQDLREKLRNDLTRIIHDLVPPETPAPQQAPHNSAPARPDTTSNKSAKLSHEERELLLAAVNAPIARYRTDTGESIYANGFQLNKPGDDRNLQDLLSALGSLLKKKLLYLDQNLGPSKSYYKLTKTGYKTADKIKAANQQRINREPL